MYWLVTSLPLAAGEGLPTMIVITKPVWLVTTMETCWRYAYKWSMALQNYEIAGRQISK
jgi:hypothetical protein